MAQRRERTTKARTPLSRERVLDAAVELADEDGIESLSMRKLARRLGVEAMSLYNHVANKDEILGGIVERVADEIELPDTGDWKARIRRSAISTRDAYVRHAWASRLQMSRQRAGRAQLRRADWTLRVLREAGLSEELTYHSYHIIEAYILGATVQNLEFPYRGEELADLATKFLEQLPVDEYPDLVQHVHDHLQPPDGKGGFELGLDLILEGLERQRDAPSAAEERFEA